MPASQRHVRVDPRLCEGHACAWTSPPRCSTSPTTTSPRATSAIRRAVGQRDRRGERLPARRNRRRIRASIRQPRIGPRGPRHHDRSRHGGLLHRRRPPPRIPTTTTNICVATAPCTRSHITASSPSRATRKSWRRSRTSTPSPRSTRSADPSRRCRSTPEGDDITEQIEAHRHEFPIFEHMVVMDPPAHERARSLLSKLLTPRRLKENEDFMWGLVDTQLDEFIANGKCEFLSEYARPFATLAITDLLGVPEDDRGRVPSRARRREAGGQPGGRARW